MVNPQASVTCATGTANGKVCRTVQAAGFPHPLAYVCVAWGSASPLQILGPCMKWQGIEAIAAPIRLWCRLANGARGFLVRSSCQTLQWTGKRPLDSPRTMEQRILRRPATDACCVMLVTNRLDQWPLPCHSMCTSPQARKAVSPECGTFTRLCSI